MPVLTDIGNKFQGIKPVKYGFGKWLKNSILMMGFGTGLGDFCENGRQYDLEHGQSLTVGYLDEVKVVDGVDAEICIIPEHGNIIVCFEFRPILFQMRPPGLPAPHFFIQRHNQEPDVRVLLYKFLAFALTELTQGELGGGVCLNRCDKRNMRQPLGIDRCNQTDFFRRFKCFNIICTQ